MKMGPEHVTQSHLPQENFFVWALRTSDESHELAMLALAHIRAKAKPDHICILDILCTKGASEDHAKSPVIGIKIGSASHCSLENRFAFPTRALHELKRESISKGCQLAPTWQSIWAGPVWDQPGDWPVVLPLLWRFPPPCEQHW